jgi:hypothetical protein
MGIGWAVQAVPVCSVAAVDEFGYQGSRFADGAEPFPRTRARISSFLNDSLLDGLSSLPRGLGCEVTTSRSDSVAETAWAWFAGTHVHSRAPSPGRVRSGPGVCAAGSAARASHASPADARLPTLQDLLTCESGKTLGSGLPEHRTTVGP